MSIARHTSYNFLGAVAPLVVTIVVTPLYLRAIGVERYGVLAIFWSLLGSLNFMSLGMGQAIAQRLAATHEDMQAERSRLVWTASAISLAAGLAGAAAVFGIGHLYFSMFAAVPSSILSEIKDTLPWLAASFPLTLLNNVMGGAFQGRKLFGLSNLIQVATVVLTALVPLAIAYLIGVSLKFLVIGTVSVSLTALIIQLFMCRRLIPLFGPEIGQQSTTRGLLQFGGWTAVSLVVGFLLVYFDRLAIGAVLGAPSVAYYVLPSSVVGQVVVLPIALASALLPALASTDLEKSRTVRRDSLLALSALLTPATIVFLVAIAPFLELWIGREAAVVSTPVAYALMLGVWANSLARIPLVHLQAHNRPDLPAKVHLAELIPYFALLYFSLQQFGLVGAAIAWTIRSAVDAVALLIIDETHPEVLKTLAAQATLVFAAVAITSSNIAPVEKLVLLGAIGAICLFLSARTLPFPLGTFLLLKRR